MSSAIYVRNRLFHGDRSSVPGLATVRPFVAMDDDYNAGPLPCSMAVCEFSSGQPPAIGVGANPKSPVPTAVVLPGERKLRTLFRRPGRAVNADPVERCPGVSVSILRPPGLSSESRPVHTAFPPSPSQRPPFAEGDAYGFTCSEPDPTTVGLE